VKSRRFTGLVLLLLGAVVLLTTMDKPLVEACTAPTGGTRRFRHMFGDGLRWRDGQAEALELWERVALHARS